MPSTKITINLTDDQQKALKPLWERVVLANLKNQKGAILMQPTHAGIVSCIFASPEQAEKIAEILKELK